MVKVKKIAFARYVAYPGFLIGGGGWAEPQITRNDGIKIFRKERLFMGQRYCKMEDIINCKMGQKLGPGELVTWILLKGKDLNQKFKKFSKIV